MPAKTRFTRTPARMNERDWAEYNTALQETIRKEGMAVCHVVNVRPLHNNTVRNLWVVAKPTALRSLLRRPAKMGGFGTWVAYPELLTRVGCVNMDVYLIHVSDEPTKDWVAENVGWGGYDAFKLDVLSPTEEDMMVDQQMTEASAQKAFDVWVERYMRG